VVNEDPKTTEEKPVKAPKEKKAKTPKEKKPKAAKGSKPHPNLSGFLHFQIADSSSPAIEFSFCKQTRINFPL